MESAASVTVQPCDRPLYRKTRRGVTLSLREFTVSPGSICPDSTRSPQREDPAGLPRVIRLLLLVHDGERLPILRDGECGFHLDDGLFRPILLVGDKRKDAAGAVPAAFLEEDPPTIQKPRLICGEPQLRRHP